METFRSISEAKTPEGLTIAIVTSEQRFERFLVRALDGPNGFVDLFETSGTSPFDRALAERVMKAAFAAAVEAELRALLDS